MQGCADAGEAPLLIDPQVGDQVRHPEAGAGVDRERVVGDQRGGRDQEAVGRQVHRARLVGGGAFERDVPERPLPNWAV
jgi:hypothetical protein